VLRPLTTPVVAQFEALRDIARMERDFVQMPEWQHEMLSFDFRKDRI